MTTCEAKNPCGGIPTFEKGDGRDVNPNVKYYFLRVPEAIAKKEGFMPEQSKDRIYNTSEVIKKYIDGQLFNNSLDHRNHGDHGRDYMYFVRLNSNTSNFRLNNIYIQGGADTFFIPNVHNEHHLEKTMSEAEITRHHIIEADQYLKEIHGKVIRKIANGVRDRNHDHVILDGDKPWASGNLVLGPPPEMNYHDGTKSVKNTGEGFFKPRKRQIHGILGYDSGREEQIEVWMLSEKMKRSPKINQNIKCIKLCFQYLSKYTREQDIDQKKRAAEEFQKEWSNLEKLPMMVGIWSPANYNNSMSEKPSVKWKCTAL